MPHWTAEDIPDQTDRIAVVTGANTGIGLETARELVRKGATVVLACRNEDKARAAIHDLHAESPSGTAVFSQLDLADLASVEAFAERFKAEYRTLDLLILNAGVMVPPAGSKTAQGFELQFGVNHLGHYALTGHLLPHLAAEARVVVVSSTAAQMGSMDFDDLHFERKPYKPWPAYGQSKLANQLFVVELQRRLQAIDSSIRVTAAHPGWTATDLQRNASIAAFFSPFLGMKPPRGALPTLRAATDPDAKPASYYGPDGLLQMRGYPVPIDLLPQGTDAETAERLWSVSETLTGVAYEWS